MTEPVHIAPYDPAWLERFEQERLVLQDVLSEWIVGGIEHVGSTAVVGLVAKPIVDIMVGVESLAGSAPAKAVLQAHGWLYAPYRADLMHWFCKPSVEHRTHHLHLVVHGSAVWHERLTFRDRLRADPRLAAEYAELKRQLADAHRFDREAYTEAKSPFIARVLDAPKARAGPHDRP